MPSYIHTSSHARRSRTLSVLVITMLFVGLLGLQPHSQVQAQDNAWSPEERLTGGGVDSVGPDIAIDSQGTSHVVYTETDFGDKGDVYYINNQGGTWSSPRLLSDGTRTEPGGGQKSVSIASYTANGVITIGVAYQARRNDGSRRILFRESKDAGATWGPIETATSHTSLHPSLIYDDTGQPHLVYTKGGDGDLYARYATKVATGWTNEGIGNDVDRNPDITYLRDANGALWLHAFYQTAKGFSAGQGDLRVVSRYKSPGGTWSGMEERDRDIALYPKLASDHATAIYAVWSAKEGGMDIDPFFSVSTDNGRSWGGVTPVGTQSGDVGQRPAIARSPATGTLAVVWEDDYEASEFKYDIYGRMSTDGGETWSELQTVFRASGGSGSANIAANPTGGFRTVWDDGNTGRLRVFTSGYNDSTPGSAPPAPPTPPAAPVATIDAIGLPGNPDVVVGPEIQVAINLVSGIADQYQLSNDGVTYLPATFAPFVPGQPVTWSVIQQPVSACYEHALFGRVRSSLDPTVVSTIVTDTFKVDPGVDVTVEPTSPWGGDPNYTRDDVAAVRVTANAGECSGLTMVDVAPLEPTDGLQNVTVTVGDSAGNIQEYSVAVTRDTQAPVLAATGGTMTAQPANPGQSVNAALVNIDFSNVAVTDDYISTIGQPWGVELSNSRSNILITDTQRLNTLQWEPVPLDTVAQTSSGYSFAVSKWNLLRGLNDGTPGTYYIYARVLDGAGNGSVEVLKTSIEVDADLSATSLFLPLLVR